METVSNDREDLGLGLKPGDAHYRAYVGPPEDYDLIAAMTFNLLTTLGLRQHHSLLDIGCGSLRIGRLFIPYLNRGKYFGVEPNEWLVDEGIRRELGESLVQIKRPTFFFSDSPPPFLRFCSLIVSHSHSIVAGGFDEISYTTRFTPRTSFTMRVEIRPSTSYGSRAQSAVMPSTLSTARKAITFS